jgi:NADPH2 dehydrogenase
MPPMVCFGYGDDHGFVTHKNLDHYRERAEGGPGVIVVEATCVSKNGRITPTQLGIWSDDHIEGLSQLAGIIKSSGAVAMLQIHHSGLITPGTITDIPAGPSADHKNPKSRGLTVDEIQEIKESFIKAALRTQQAGFDGVQLHGAHGYLLSQFASTYYNQRNDDFGGTMEGRMKLAVDIIDGIRENCGETLLLSYRMGANSPTLEDGIAIARYLEQQKIDLLDVSHGGTLVSLPRPPKDFDYNWICYSGTEVKKAVNLPVSVVNEIRTPERANVIIENNLADFVNLGRPILADPHWVIKAQHHEEMIVSCQRCKPRCKWYIDSSLCPALKIRMQKGL